MDDDTRYSWIFPLKNKGEVLAAFIQFKQLVEKQFERKIKMLQSNWGGEYRSFTQLMQNEGIIFRQSFQNGRVKRRHKQIVECGLTLLAQAGMPLHYWWEAFQTSVHLINRLPSTGLSNQSLYKVLFQKNPDYKSLKVFGCACYPNLRAYNTHKFAFHSTKCVYLDLSQHHKGFLCLSSIGCLYVSRHVVFNEQEFPFKFGFLNTKQPEHSVTRLPLFPLTSWQQESRMHDEMNNNNSDQNTRTSSPSTSSSESSSSSKGIQCDSPVSPTKEYLHVMNEKQLEVCDADNASTISKGREEHINQGENRVTTRSMKGITKPKQPYVSLVTEQSKKCTSRRVSKGNTSDTTVSVESQSVVEALSSPQWKAAMKDELDALKKNNTWELVPYHSDLRVVDCRWVFKTKFKPNGDVERYKARLVAKGFQQDPGVIFGNTFSPVARITTIRIILALATTLNWRVRQLDVNNTFLNEVLHKDVFMWQPKGFEDAQKPHHVCKLRKALYELKQALRAWFESLKTTLIKWGFYNTKGDTSLFVHSAGKSILIIIIYVDDILVTGSDANELENFIVKLNKVFALKDLGNVHYFLGLEVKRDDTWMFMSQKKYMMDLLERFDMKDCSPCPSPMVSGKQFTEGSDDNLRNPTIFRRLIDALQYVTNARPDITFSVNKLSRYLNNPSVRHWQAAKRILRYLKGTIDFGIHLKLSSSLRLCGYCDAD